MTISFRDHLFPLDHPRLAGLAAHDACSYADACAAEPVVGDAIRGWLGQFESTRFEGITADGHRITGLFDDDLGECVPNTAAIAAARDVLAEATEDQRRLLTHPMSSRVWRAWMNPEFYLNRYGLRLEDVGVRIRELLLAVVEASLSPAGFAKVRDVMRTNAFLGDLVGLPKIMNEGSYNINFFGEPSLLEPWGWNLYGHHLALNCLFLGDKQVLTPAFFGAEPNCIDTGAWAGTELFVEQEAAALEFIRALPPDQAQRATLIADRRKPEVAPQRWHPGDQLHLAGAFQDNRVIGYEGLPVTLCAPAHRQQLVALVELFINYQPAGPRAARLAAVRSHLDQTWFCWMGGTGDDDPFYFRIQSPVILIELDHHSGVFLANQEAERFHTHTIVRTPNGNDYGAALVGRFSGEAVRLDGPA
ncbi:DUF3500 domain-containing protein [Mycolicibacterium sp. CBM1]